MIFEQVLAKLKPVAKKQNDRVEMIEINRLIRERLDVYPEIGRLLYVYKDHEKFVRKESTNQIMLNPAKLGNIQEYIQLKKLVCNSSPLSMEGVIEFSQLVSFCRQVR